MKVQDFEKIYNFSFDVEMQKKRESMIHDLEFETGFDETEQENKDKLRNLFIQVMNSKHPTDVHDLFDANFHSSPFAINKSYNNKIDYVSAIECYIDRILYNILDDGELFFVKYVNGKKWGIESNGFFFSDSDSRDYKARLKCTYGEKAKFKSIYIGSIDQYIAIVSELLNEQNYYESKDLQSIFFEDEKAFDKYFVKK